MKKPLAIIGAIVLAIAVIAVAVFVLARPKPAPTTTGRVLPQASRADTLVRADSYQRGDADAPVTVVEFIDFQCEACAFMHPIIQQILDAYVGKVRLVVRYFPLDQHKNAKAAVFAAEAAGALGKYWDMYDTLMAKRQEWSESDNPWPIFGTYAKELGLDGFPADSQTAAGQFSAKGDRDTADVKALQVTGVPHFFMNGVRYGYLKSYEELKEKIEKEMALCGRTTMTQDDIDNGRLLCSRK